MRGPWLLLPLALAACEREPSFQDRYDNAQAAILDTSAELDNEMRAAALNEADAGRVPAPPPPAR